MNPKQASILVIILLLAVTTVTAYALVTVDGSIIEAEWTAPSTTCANDAGGANDNIGGARDDLTRSCVYEGEYYSTNNIFLYWNWDETAFTIATESCALFGTATAGMADDANADYALCGTVNGSPTPSLTSAVLYSCDNTSPTSCGTPVVVDATANCAVDSNANDPFVGGAGYPNDTTIECQIPVADIGGSLVTQDRVFLDVCAVAGVNDCLGAPDVPLAISLNTISVDNNNAGIIAAALGFALAASSFYVVRRRQTI